MQEKHVGVNGSRLIRAYQADDATSVVALYERAHREEATVPAISLDAWRAFLALPQNRSGRDFRIAVHGDRVVGVATSSLRDHEDPWSRYFRIVVDPACRRRKIGTDLLRDLAGLDPARDVVLQTLCPEEWRDGTAFLDAMGFVCFERELDMECRRPAPGPSKPTDAWTLRHVSDVAACAERVAEIHNSAYAGTSSFVRFSGPQMAAHLGSGADLWVAETGGRAIGFCHLEAHEKRVWVESLAVDPPWRGRGVATALLQEALARTIAGGDRTACLSVADPNPAAQRIYRRLGFEVTRVSRRYRASSTRALARG